MNRSSIRSLACLVLAGSLLPSTSACLRLQESDFDGTTTTGLLWPLLFARRSFALGQLDTNSVQGVRLGMNGPYKISVAGNRLFVSDASNRRGLIYNSLPTTNQAAPDVAVGQPDIFTTLISATNYPVEARYVNRGRAIYSDGTRLFIVDNSGHRVLIWNSIPTTNLQPADVVLGQPDFNSSGTGTSATTLNSPEGVAACGEKLFVADSANNRVLIWNSIPTTNGKAADVVVGQVDFISGGSGTTATTFTAPRGVYCDGTKLYVADSQNNRVLIFNSIPTANNAAANVVVGQANLTSNISGNANVQMSGPEGVAVNGSNLYVADTANNRVLVFTSIPVTDTQAADAVLGQPGFGAAGANNPSTVSGLQSPRGVAADGTNVYITDTGNNRVVIHTTPAPSNGSVPAIVLGQPDLNTTVANNVTPTATIYQGSGGTSIVGERLFVAASDDNRVLGYNTIPTTSGVAADFVIGQTNFTNDGSGSSATQLSGSASTCASGSVMYVVDTQNNRVLGYNPIPTATNAAADFVLGQVDFTSNMANKGSAVAADTLASPTTVHCEPDRLLVVDSTNNRVLIYSPLPTATNTAASIVVGQADLVSAVAATTQAGLSGPQGAIIDSNGRLIIADTQVNRVVIHNTVPTTNGASADLVLGQADFTSPASNGGASGPTSSGFSFPNSILVLNNNLLISDLFNNRILIWNSFPTTNNQPADRVFGQSSFTELRPNLGGVSGTTLNAPFALTHHNGYIYITDAFNQRVLGVLAGDMGLTGF